MTVPCFWTRSATHLGIASQVKLLRLLQEGEYYPLGSDRPKRLRARVIVATHADLAAKEGLGQFRRDLYYRLKTHQVRIPALQDSAVISRCCWNTFWLRRPGTWAEKPTAPRGTGPAAGHLLFSQVMYAS